MLEDPLKRLSFHDNYTKIQLIFEVYSTVFFLRISSTSEH